ncbi:unnamed protein product [Closterium sp. NIES-54]
MDRRGSACPAHALRLVAVLLIITVAPATAGRRIDTLGTTTNAESAGTATTAGTASSVDATAGAAALDLAALAVDAKTRAEIKALAPLIGAADLTGVGKPPERASYLTKDAFAVAARKWLAAVKQRVQKLIQQAAGGGGKGRGTSKGSSEHGTTVDRSLGYVPPTTKDLNPAKLPNLNTVSRYLTVGLTLDPTSQKLTWDFKKSVSHSKYFPEDDFDQGNCGSCWAYAAARAVQGAYAKLKETDDDVFPSGMSLSVQQLVDCTGAAASCRGGYPEAALQYAAKFGLQDEASYAYTGASGKCSVNKDTSTRYACLATEVRLSTRNAPRYSESALLSLPYHPSPPLSGILQHQHARAGAATRAAGAGGWPVLPLPYRVLSLPYHPSPSLNPLHHSQDFFNISMYEQVPLPGPLGLILALQKQPVIVTIRASSQDFIDYAEGIYEGLNCYSPVGEVVGDTQGNGFRATATATNNTGLLDHVMLAVGYNYDVPGSEQNYFILKNSWGPDWGENGYMRIRMEGDALGTCGMLVNRGLYPVVNAHQTIDPCGTSPCGGGTCVADESGNGKYTCQCSDLLVPAENRDGTPTCTISEWVLVGKEECFELHMHHQ